MHQLNGKGIDDSRKICLVLSMAIRITRSESVVIDA